MAQSNTTHPERTPRKPVLQFTRRRVYGGIAFALAACSWTFFLGVLVGRGTAPVHFDIEKLGHDLQMLREQVQEHRARDLTTYSAAVENKSELDFYEDLKQPGEAFAIEPGLTRSPLQPAMVPETLEGAAPTEGDSSPISSEPPDATAAIDAGDIPVIKRMIGLQPKKKTAVSPPKAQHAAAVPKGPVAPAGALTLQVASLRDAQTADAMAARLRDQGYAASRASVTIPGKGTWYRVQVGRFADRQSAAATIRSLESMGLKPILVSR